MALSQVGLERLNTATTDKLGIRKNKIINGGMTVSQRQTSTTNSSAFVVDRFKAEITQMDELVQTLEQSSDAPDGFGKSIKITTTTPESSIASNEQFRIQTKLEGQDFQDLAYGTSAAKTITISFYVKASVTGTFGFTVYRDESTDRVITAPYTISSADTWEKKTITIPGDTAGAAITNDNSERFRLMWGLAAGANFNTASPSWGNYSSANLLGGHVTNTLVTTNNATWQLSGVQLEVGSVATDFEHRSFAEELALCQRYYFRFTTSVSGTHVAMGHQMTSSAAKIVLPFPTSMRTRPTAVETTGTASDYSVARTSTHEVCNVVPTFAGASKEVANVNTNQTQASLSTGIAVVLRANTTAFFLGFSAEL
tara:strand:+ start:26 stop:1132 length:1107 start_codon:yes stop_codon:yes gene_type:complete